MRIRRRGQGAAKKGESLLLRKQMGHRFSVIPDWVDQKLAQARNEDLELWGRKILDAETLEDVFASPSDSG